jgi:uncharacterized membrane-anchored protein
LAGALLLGTDSVLEMQPVDPRDLRRGDFVILRYDMSRVALNDLSPPANESAQFTSKQHIYAELRPDGEFHGFHRASLDPLAP